MIAEGSGSFFGAEVPRIEHEHDDEHEHDSLIERRALLFQVVLYCFYGNIGKLALEQSLAGERTKKR